MGFWKWMRSRYDYRKMMPTINGAINFCAYVLGGFFSIVFLATSFSYGVIYVLPSAVCLLIGHWGWYREFAA